MTRCRVRGVDCCDYGSNYSEIKQQKDEIDIRSHCRVLHHCFLKTVGKKQEDLQFTTCKYQNPLPTHDNSIISSRIYEYTI
jgi:hypothetical protein